MATVVVLPRGQPERSWCISSVCYYVLKGGDLAKLLGESLVSLHVLRASYRTTCAGCLSAWLTSKLARATVGEAAPMEISRRAVSLWLFVNFLDWLGDLVRNLSSAGLPKPRQDVRWHLRLLLVQQKDPGQDFAEFDGEDLVLSTYESDASSTYTLGTGEACC